MTDCLWHLFFSAFLTRPSGPSTRNRRLSFAPSKPDTPIFVFAGKTHPQLAYSMGFATLLQICARALRELAIFSRFHPLPPRRGSLILSMKGLRPFEPEKQYALAIKSGSDTRPQRLRGPGSCPRWRGRNIVVFVLG